MLFIDLRRQYESYKDQIRSELDRVLDDGRFILGPAVSELEAELAKYAGVKNAIGCSSGTDALLLAMMALGLKAGDEVIVPDFTFFATAETVSLLGGVPVFVDIQPDTFNVDPDKIESKISARTRGIIAVSLFGQCADFDELTQIARKHNLFLIEDAAQSFGATYKGRKSCSLSEIATTSFYPAKPLGAYGDAGALFTNDDALAERVRNTLNHGQISTYKHRYVGINGRLDSLQAAILKVKLRHFPWELQLRQKVASWYDKELAGLVSTPCVRPGNSSSWAQYTVRARQRLSIQKHLRERDIPTAVHYPAPLHHQEAYSTMGICDEHLPESVKASTEVLSFPMHPFLTLDEVRTVAAAVGEALQ